MRNTLTCAVVVVVLSLCGCTKDQQNSIDHGIQTAAAVVDNATPAQIADLSGKAGKAAAKGWIASTKPTAKTKAEVAVIMDMIAQAVGGVADGSFVGAMPQIQQAIAGAIKDVTTQNIATGMATAALMSLDLLFSQHDGWSADKDKASAGVAAFCAAFKDGLK